MSDIARIALVAAIALTGSVVQAAPRHRTKVVKKVKHKKAAPVVETSDDDETSADSDDDSDDEDAKPVKRKSRARTKRAHKTDVERVALADSDTDSAPIGESLSETESETESDVVASIKARKTAAVGGQDWHLAFGPYLWVPSVEADVSIGGMPVGGEVDPAAVAPSAKFGIEAVAEARYGRFSVAGDLLYGVIGLAAGTSTGPVMVSVDGEVSAALLDGMAGYTLVGDDRSTFSIEARAGVRYQRTAITAAVGVSGAVIAPPQMVFAGSDALAGARVFVRPYERLTFSASADLGVFGASTKTWSGTADATVRLTKHVQLSAGWKTLALERSIVNVKLFGPRATLQILF